MKITQVRFGSPVEVVKTPKGAHTVWRSGEDDLLSIADDIGGRIAFRFDDHATRAGFNVLVYPPLEPS